jgi:hypothetical protein
VWLIRQGLHPTSTTQRRTVKIKPDATCGTCHFCQPLDLDVPPGRTTYKCWRDGGRWVTRGAATDIRKSWPACIDWRNRIEEAV